MNIDEFHIDRLQKQIKRIEENPDPTRLKSNKMLYELQIEEHKALLQAEREHRPQSYSSPGITPLWLALGILSGHDSSQDNTRATYLEGFMNKAREKGFPVDNACEMSMAGLARWAAGEATQLARAPMCNLACTGFWLSDTVMHHMKPEPMYFLSKGFEENEDSLKYVVEQLQEYITFAENMYPGIVKYDEAKLAEIQSYMEQAEMYCREMYYLQRNRPAPLASKQAFRLAGPLPVGIFPNPKKMVEYARIKRDEVAELVAKGIGGVPNEKLRFIWTVSRPWFMDPFPTLEKRGAAAIIFFDAPSQRYPVPKKRFWGDRQLTPLEKVAATMLAGLVGGTAKRWTDHVLWICKDLQLDGIINYNMVGCSAAVCMKKMVEERAEKELGIPVLQLEGKQFSSTFAGEAEINRHLNEFIDLCLNKKGIN